MCKIYIIDNISIQYEWLFDIHFIFKIYFDLGSSIIIV